MFWKKAFEDSMKVTILALSSQRQENDYSGVGKAEELIKLSTSAGLRNFAWNSSDLSLEESFENTKKLT